MANNPNDYDPKPLPPNDPSDVPPAPEEDALDEVRIEDLPDLGPVDLAELSGDLPLDDPNHDGGVWSERAPDPGGIRHSDLPEFAEEVDEASAKAPSSFSEEGLVDLPDLADAVENDSAHLFKPPANPLPSAGPTSMGAMPVAPASGWFDPEELQKTANPKLTAEREFSDSDLFGGPPGKANDLLAAIESSDIFSGGPIPDADLAATSDVLLGAALDYATTDRVPEVPGETPAVGSPSELPIGMMPEPEPEFASAIESGPVLEDLGPPEDETAERTFDENDSLFDGLDSDAPVATDHFSSGELFSSNPPDVPTAETGTPPKSDRPKLHGPAGDSDLRELGLSPDFGATPKHTPDASSILADLSMMNPEQRYESASEVRLDSPGFSRTIGGTENHGEEFGLEGHSDLEQPQAPDSASIVWSVLPDAAEVSPDDIGTVPEVSLDDVQPVPPIRPVLERTEISLPVRRPVDPDADASVEFTDFPEADDESTASQVFGAALREQLPRSGTNPQATDESNLPTMDWASPPSESDLELPPELAPDVPARGSKPSIGGLAGMPIRRPSSDPDVPNKDRPSTKLKATSDAAKDTSSPSVEIDWTASSMPHQPVSSTSTSKVGPVAVANWGSESIVQRGPAAAPEQEPVAEEYAEETSDELEDPIHTRRTKPDMSMRSEPKRSGKGGWLGGTLVGMVIAGGACAGAYFGGFIPNTANTANVPPKQPDPNNPDENSPGAKPPTHAEVAAAIRAGDAATAKKLAATVKEPSPMMKAAHGEAELFSLVQEQKEGTPIAANDPTLKSALAKLQSFVDDPNATKGPEGDKAAVKATIQLGIVYHLAGETDNARKLYLRAKDKYPKYTSTFEAALDRLEETAPAAVMPEGSSRRITPDDARQLLLAAIILLQDEPPAKADDTEAGVFFWKAVRLAKSERYTEAVELIKKAKTAHIKQAKAMAGRGLNPLSDPLEQIFPRSCDDLKAYWELQAAIAENKTVAEAFAKDGAGKALMDLEKKAAGAVKLMTDLKDATEKLTVAAKDLKDAKDLVAKLEKDFKEADDAKLLVEKKLDAEEKARKGADEIVMGVVKELQAAKLLPEKYDSAELLAAQKRALDRATGPALSSLLSSEMMAVGGFGLSAGQLIDIADRLSKAERATKIATDKLASEVKRLTAEHAEAMKKLTDAHATDVSKLKDDQTADLKKAADKYAADSKKLTETFEAKIKDLDAAVAAEKKRTEEIAAKFKTDLGNAVTPAQAIDLWLPLLVELRRPSDAEGALAAAAKSLTTSQPNSEDVGKARTVAGLALLFQNKYTEANAQFRAATSNPNYEAALTAKKLWATAAEIGLQSVTDPLAAYRRAPELPNRDTANAARFLDAGIRAYKEGQHKDAVTLLTESTKSDATDAVAWYFLGASKMATGSTDQAKDDIRQGAMREAASTVPTHVISRALSPIQGPARDLITAARP